MIKVMDVAAAMEAYPSLYVPPRMLRCAQCDLPGSELGIVFEEEHGAAAVLDGLKLGHYLLMLTMHRTCASALGGELQ